ncbi:MBL fold metallo-hydrolase [Thermosyntropha sp.]|uniref:MBL fold metallo-hydrolase n=1 Tax=Thermosyntropha sp. TaxID=2740820 RepID=UPI0025CB7A0D|nr:MBL fold metallo-hydrolase [Thermosyntropha sp.]MBO8159594.1 MBL fold metallo-hydrolase [Thermosyntropha sp.]
MVEKIKDNLYKLEIPLPFTPLKALNSYVIKGKERNMIVDTGFNRPECLDAMKKGLDELKIDLNKTDIFVTHMHADHSGLVSSLASAFSKVYCSSYDAGIINASLNKERWYEILQETVKYGFPAEEDITEYLPGKKYKTSHTIDFIPVREGDTLNIGEYFFVCIETPGHTPGHICLYESREKILISGDHILDKITPNISKWFNTFNPLEDYLQSLDKIAALEVDLVLPGHRDVITDCRKRIDELKQHHDKRCWEVLRILKGKTMDAYTVASKMKWDITLEWNDFPVPQKWFALGEAVSHLKFLASRGLVEEFEGEKVFYSC